jgi:dihydroorotate dehydrogenase (NAD+) catalytic subunit
VKRKRAVVTHRTTTASHRIPTPGSGAARRPTRSRPVVPLAPSPPPAPMEVDLSVDLAPSRHGALVLRNPLLVASGTFGYGIEYGEVVDIDRLGAICCKGTTLKARVGNPPPRVTETPAGMLNSIGLQNPGVDAVLERYAPRWATWEVPVIVNVAGESVEDYVAVARKLDEQPGVAGIELNISCPNVGKGGLQFALDARAAAEVTAAVRRATELPLLVKLSPAATDVRGIATAIEDAGADAICAVNTLSGMAIDRQRRKPMLGNTYGGLSGPALKPVALRVVYEVAQVVDIPIVAIGGVSELDDVLDFLMAGACAVQVGTALFADPVLPVRLIDELEAWCRGRGMASHRELVGVALPSRRDRPSVKGVEYRP